MQEHKKRFYEKYVKRLLDIGLSIFFLLFFWWVYIIIAFLVRIKLGSPVLFIQERPGKDEKIFKLYKFRSMTEEKDEEGKLLSDDVRLTQFGKLLRSTSLDELPEIFNILKGDMSIVGPRPLLIQYLPLYSKEQRKRHDVSPGLTGYAQIHGRNSISWDEKFRLDVWYVEHISFMLDCKIIFKTVCAVIKREGISIDIEAFQGSNIDL